MNTAELAESLKLVPDQHLAAAVQGNVPSTPGYLALAEMKRRQSLRSGQAQAPMTTVAQDQGQMPQPGIAGVRGYAHGGLVRGYAEGGGVTPYGGIYGGGDVLGKSPYEGMSILEFLSQFGEDFGGSVNKKSKAIDAWLKRKLVPEQYGEEAVREQLMRGYAPREPQGPIRTVQGQQPAMQTAPPVMPPPAGVVPGAAPRPPGPGGLGIAGVGAPRAPALTEEALTPPPDLVRRDPSEYLSKVPTSKILEGIVRDSQIDPEQFKKRRSESRNEALVRAGAALASRPGGFGGAFGPALVSGLESRKADEKEIRAEEREAKKALRDLRLMQAQEEMARYGTARELSKEERQDALDAWARKNGVEKDSRDYKLKKFELDQRAQLEREKMKNDLKAAGIRAASSGGDPEMKRLQLMEKASDNARQRVKDAMENPSTAFKYKTIAQRNALYEEFFAAELARYGLTSKAPAGTVPSAGTGVPQRINTLPSGPIR